MTKDATHSLWRMITNEHQYLFTRWHDPVLQKIFPILFTGGTYICFKFSLNPRHYNLYRQILYRNFLKFKKSLGKPFLAKKSAVQGTYRVVFNLISASFFFFRFLMIDQIYFLFSHIKSSFFFLIWQKVKEVDVQATGRTILKTISDSQTQALRSHF